MRKPNAKRIVRPARKRRDAYKSYNFIDKDPVIHEVWDIVKGTSFGYIEEESGVSVSCLMSWFYGPTRKPQNATVRAVVRAMGYDYKIVKMGDIEAPVAKNKPAPKMVRLRVIDGGKSEAPWKQRRLSRLPKLRHKAG